MPRAGAAGLSMYYELAGAGPVDSTAREAHDRGFRVIVLMNGCASATPARHEASLANLGFLGEVLVTNDALERIAHQST